MTSTAGTQSDSDAPASGSDKPPSIAPDQAACKDGLRIVSTDSTTPATVVVSLDEITLSSPLLLSPQKAPLHVVKSDEESGPTAQPAALGVPTLQHVAVSDKGKIGTCRSRAQELLRQVQEHFYSRVIPYGGLVSNCFSLASVTLGGGIISMPSSFSTSGIAMAVIYLVVMCALTVYTVTIMGYVMKKTKRYTFEQVATVLFGRRWGYVVGFIMWISCVGAAIGYISAVSGLITPIVQLAPGTPAYLKTTSGNRLLTSMIWLVFMLPVVIPKRVNSIRYVSAVGCVMVLYFVAVIVAHSSTHGLKLGMRDDMKLFTTGNKAIYGLSIFMFAYLCQAMCQTVYMEMRPKPSVRQLTWAALISMTVCTVFYVLAGFFGYMDFAGQTRDSILYNFDPVHQPYVMVAYVGMLVKICAAYAVNMIPCRNVIYHVLKLNIDTMPYWKHIVVVLLMSTAALLCGLFIPSVNMAFGLVGSLCGGFVGFVFPALFWMYCGNWSLKTVGIWHYLATYLLIVSGVIAIVFGTIATIYQSFFDMP